MPTSTSPRILVFSDYIVGNIFVKQTDADGNIIPASEHLKIRDRSRVSNHVVLVDAGMVARLVDSEQENFIGLLQSMGRGRGDEAAKFILNFSARRDYTEAQRADFTSDMKALFERVCRGYHHNVNIGVVLKNILTLVLHASTI